MADCKRHFSFKPNDPGPYRTVRCSHLGSRFVVEIVNDDSGYRVIDYVEIRADDDIVVETNDVFPDGSDAHRDALWNRLIERMERGESPRSEG